MKPPLFDYVTPESIEDAVAARAAEEDSVVLAGGQSLIPTLNFRIANPAMLIDISRIKALKSLDVGAEEIAIGAMVRQRQVEKDDAVHRANPLLREVLGTVAHTVVRNRGTVAGSIAHADAAAELPAMLLATDGAVDVCGPAGVRRIAAGDLFQFHLTTNLAADEIITAVRVPALAPNTGWAFMEFARRHGDYALAGICALVTLDDAGRCTEARLSACGIASTAVRLDKTEAELTGSRLDEAAIAAAAKAARDAVTAADDTQASAAYRRHLVDTLTRRSVAQARGRAQERRPA
jgi:carbon-monoxide dehydrogenase medium subunit